VCAVEEAGARLVRLAQAIGAQLEHWRWRPLVDALQALRGISVIHAVRIVAELGDLARFVSARKLMGYLGMIPSEDSSGSRPRQGSITKAGNRSARRALVEAAWAYAHPAARLLGDRTAANWARQEHHRLGLASATAPVRTLSAPGRTGPSIATDRGGDRPRTLRVRLGDRPERQAHLIA